MWCDWSSRSTATLEQHVYYDPGVGTLPEPNAFTWF